jgi:hypothetical protein
MAEKLASEISSGLDEAVHLRVASGWPPQNPLIILSKLGPSLGYTVEIHRRMSLNRRPFSMTLTIANAAGHKDHVRRKALNSTATIGANSDFRSQKVCLPLSIPFVLPI